MTDVETRAFTSPNDFELWVKQDWLYEPGSNEALAHIQGKLEEEVGELVEALHEGSGEDILSEGGDVLWTATAVAINNGPGVERSLKHSSYRSVIPEQLTLAAIDTIARRRWARADWTRSGGFADLDLAESRRDIHRGVRKGDLAVTERVLQDVSRQLSRAAATTHSLETLTGCDMSELIWNRDYCLWIDAAYSCETISQLYIVCSGIAQARLGMGIADMMETNRQKLLSRKERGLAITSAPANKRADL